MWKEFCAVFGSAWICFLLPRELGRLSILLLGGRLAMEEEPTEVVQEELVPDAFESLAQTYGLTDRELEIVRFMTVGRTRAFIGEQLCLSQNTIKGHMHNIYTKTGVHSKQELLNLILCGK